MNKIAFDDTKRRNVIRIANETKTIPSLVQSCRQQLAPARTLALTDQWIQLELVPSPGRSVVSGAVRAFCLLALARHVKRIQCERHALQVHSVLGPFHLGGASFRTCEHNSALQGEPTVAPSRRTLKLIYRWRNFCATF